MEEYNPNFLDKIVNNISFKGIVDSTDKLPSHNNYEGDTFVVGDTTYLWDGHSWVSLNSDNNMKIVRMNYPNVKKDTSDFESNLKKLEEKALELELREKYYGGSYNLSDKTKELMSNIIDVEKNLNIMSSTLKDWGKITVANYGSDSISSYIDDIYENWNTALAESGK